MKDKKLLWFTIFIWWVCDFLIITALAVFAFYLLTMFSFMTQILGVFGLGNSFEIHSINWLILLPMCAIIAIPITFLVIKVIIPKFFSGYLNRCRKILKDIEENGNSTETMIEVRKLHSELEPKKNTYFSIYNICTLLIAADCCDRSDFAEAYAYLDRIAQEEYKEVRKFVTIQQSYIQYLTVKLQIECSAKDRERADETYGIAKPFFDEYGEKTQMILPIEASLSYYDVLCERYEEAIARIQALEASRPSEKLMIAECLKHAYEAGKRYDEALRYYDEMLVCCKSEYTKNIIQHHRDECVALQEQISE